MYKDWNWETHNFRCSVACTVNEGLLLVLCPSPVDAQVDILDSTVIAEGLKIYISDYLI